MRTILLFSLCLIMGNPMFAQTQAGKGTGQPTTTGSGTAQRSHPQAQQAPKDTYQPQRNTPAEARPVAGQVQQRNQMDPERPKNTYNTYDRGNEHMVMVNGQLVPADQVQGTPSPVRVGGTEEHYNDGIPADVDDLFLELNNCNNKRWISLGEFLRMDEASRMIVIASSHRYCIDQVQLFFLIQLLPSCAAIYYY